ncbi:unnamed protein product [Mucor hiemalis]
MAEIFTFEEVAKHNSRNNLYMVIDKKVYDITKFVDEVFVFASQNATDAFEDVGHSPDARDMLKQYLVGEMDPESKPVKVQAPVTTNTTNKSAEGNPLRIIIPVVFFIGYIYWRFFLKQ